jgi:hypothetical protein
VRFDVLKHEQYEEICAAAAIGQASPAELAELERHARECNACREEYSECLDLAARQFAVAEKHPDLSPLEAASCLNSERFTQRFFERAEREGIVFSRGAAKDADEVAPVSLSFRRRGAWRIPAFAAAAAIVLVTISTIVFVKSSALHPNQVHLRVQEKSPAPMTFPGDFDQRLAELKVVNSKLESELLGLAAELRDADKQLSKTDADLKSTVQDRQRLAGQRNALAAQLKDLQQKLAESELVAAAAQQQSAQFHERADDLQASLVADRTRIQELTDQLAEKSAAVDRERQLLAVGHDVSDLMGARNLHIVDVVDTDTHGKTRPAFGRIFFTEGKSLIFYAYDLNEAKIAKAGNQYRVWAKKEGQDPRVQSLGIFYSDDKAQRRWVFKCNDPKILNEIDSVFVTLEPANSDPAHPKGSNLMYAYLRGQANHP